MLQDAASPASTSGLDALYKESCQMLQPLPQGCDTSVPACLRQRGLHSARAALALPPTTAAHQGRERAEGSAKAAHQSVAAPRPGFLKPLAAPLHYRTALAESARFPVSSPRSKPAAKHLGF